MTQKQIDKLSILQRATAPTPKFFRTVRAIGVVLVSVSGAVLAVPVSWPDIVTTLAGYAAVGGSAITAVSQVAVKG